MTLTTLIERNTNEAVVESGDRICIGAFGEDVLTFRPLHKEYLEMYFNATGIYHDTIDCILIQCNEDLFPSNLWVVQ